MTDSDRAGRQTGNAGLLSEPMPDEGAGQDPATRRFQVAYFRGERLVLSIVGTVAILLAWQLLAQSNVIDPHFTSYPTQIARGLVTYFTTGTGWIDLEASSKEFAIGFAITLILGIPIGLVLGWYPRIEALFKPTFDFFYNAPRIALAPLFVIWFGLGEASKIATVVFTAVFPIVISTQAAVATADKVLIDMARSFGAKDRTVVWSIVVPGSVPAICSGIRIGIGQALGGVVIAEFVAATVGLGYTVVQASTSLNTALMFDAVLVVGVIGVILTWLLGLVQNHFETWRIQQ